MATKNDRALADLTATVQHRIRFRPEYQDARKAGRAAKSRKLTCRIHREDLRTLCAALRALRIVAALRSIPGL